MKPTCISSRRVQGGIISVLGIEFLAVFAALGVAFVGVASLELQKADNRRSMMEARMAAESGLALCTHVLLSAGEWSAGPQKQDLLSVLGAGLANELGVSGPLQEGELISIPEVTLGGGQSFAVEAFMPTDDVVRVTVTGCVPIGEGAESGTLRRSISMDLAAPPVSPFKYGMFVNGPVVVGMNLDYRSVDDSNEASIYSTSQSVTIGSGYIDGDIGMAQSGGEGGIGATVNGEIYSGTGEPLMPRIDTSVFETFATNIVDANTDMSTGTFTNIRIKAGTNPIFGAVTILGVVYVEAPNYVDFASNANITGVVVTEDPGEGASLETHKIEFKNSCTMRSVEELPDTPEFAELRNIPGTSFLMPGFKLEFKNNFGSISGVMAAECIESKNNLDVTLYGSIVVFGEGGLLINNNSTITVDRTRYEGTPPGFVADTQMLSDPEMATRIFTRQLEANPDTYQEVTSY